jgi:hypothetical protein
VTNYSFYYDTQVTVSTLLTVTQTTGAVIIYNGSITPATYNVLVVKAVISFTHTRTVSADITFAIQMKIGSGSNYSINSGCSKATIAPVDPIYCTVTDVLSGSIQYTLSLMKTAFIVDQNYSTVAAAGTNT